MPDSREQDQTGASASAKSASKKPSSQNTGGTVNQSSSTLVGTGQAVTSNYQP